MPTYKRETEIRLLNHDLFGEHEAILRYLRHAWVMADTYGAAIESIARDEMRHLKWLAHTIVRLGGEPDLAVPDIGVPISPRALFEQDVAAEDEAIRQYEEHRAAIRDPQIDGLLGRILVDERDHRRQFLEMLDRWQASPAVEGQEDAAPEVIADRLQRMVATEYQAVLVNLWQSFVHQHVGALAQDFEERAVDEMKHMGWLGEALAAHGRVAHFPLGLDAKAASGSGEASETAAFAALAEVAPTQAPELVPLLHRIQLREQYQRGSGSRMGKGFSVGSLWKAGVR